MKRGWNGKRERKAIYKIDGCVPKRTGSIKMKEKIISLIEEVLNLPAGSITVDTMITDVEEWDSLAHVMIIGELEEKLGISISLDEAIEVTGVGDLLEKAGA